jgi:hypothetical protein
MSFFIGIFAVTFGHLGLTALVTRTLEENLLSALPTISHDEKFIKEIVW